MKCKCGGSYQRTDLKKVYIVDDGDPRWVWTDTDPTTSHFKCCRCGHEYIQKKRLAKAAV